MLVHYWMSLVQSMDHLIDQLDLGHLQLSHSVRGLFLKIAKNRDAADYITKYITAKFTLQSKTKLDNTSNCLAIYIY